MSVLQSFRAIYGSMRRHFRDIEDRYGFSEVVLKTFDINLTELVRYLPRRSDSFAHVPVAEMASANEAIGGYARKDNTALDIECEGR
jgi:hypothetical protein